MIDLKNTEQVLESYQDIENKLDRIKFAQKVRELTELLPMAEKEEIKKNMSIFFNPAFILAEEAIQKVAEARGYTYL